MRRELSVLAIASTLAACGNDTPSTVDAGTDAGMVTLDGGADDAGADAGATDGGSDAGTTPTDAPMSDAGSLDALISFAAECPAFSPCGGDVIGTWNYESICITNDEVTGPFEGTCPGTELLMGSGAASGVVTLTGTEITRTVSTSVEVTIALGSSCTALCSAAPGIIESRLPGSTVTCAVDSGDGRCHCDLAYGSAVDETEGYTLTKGGIVTASGRTFNYCLETDGSFRYREVGPMPEPGVSTSVGGG